MKKVLLAGLMILGLNGWARAVAGPAGPLLGINQNISFYNGQSTFTIVDPANVTASVIVNNLTANGNAAIAGNSTFAGNITAAGTLTIPAVTSSGTQTTSGLTVFTPTTQTNVSTTTTISPTATFLIVRSTGGAVTFPVTSAIPAIATATATNGQWLILQSTDSTNTVVITTGSATAVYGDDSTITLSATKTPVTFIFNSLQNVWWEISKQ